jgi:deoxyhypusine monooxygenase
MNGVLLRYILQRYSALFALRNKGGKEAVNVLTEVFKARSALIKHEVAYVLGQMMDKHGTENLLKVLRDSKEHAM